jgi:hypothetical protein
MQNHKNAYDNCTSDWSIPFYLCLVLIRLICITMPTNSIMQPIWIHNNDHEFQAQYMKYDYSTLIILAPEGTSKEQSLVTEY